MRIIKLKPLDQNEFSKFGKVLDANVAKPQIDYCINILSSLDGARTNVSLINAPIIQLPSIITVLERRPLSWQSYFPLGNTHYLVVVAHSGPYGSPNLETLTGFSVPSGIGVSFHPKTWHAHPCCFSDPGHLVMIVEEFATFGDCNSLQIDPFKLVE